MKTLTCYGRVRTKNSQQEWYDSKSGDARIRARELRSIGFRVSVDSSEQITTVGRCRMSLVTISAGDADMDCLPDVSTDLSPVNVVS